MKEQVLNAVFIARNCNTHKVGRNQGELLIFAFPHCCVTVINGLNNNKKLSQNRLLGFVVIWLRLVSCPQNDEIAKK